MSSLNPITSQYMPTSAQDQSVHSHSSAAEGCRAVFLEFQWNGLPVLNHADHDHCQSWSEQYGDREPCHSKSPPLDFLYNVPDPIRYPASFSTNQGQRGFRTVPNNLKGCTRLWSDEELQSACNSLRQTHWNIVLDIEQVETWHHLLKLFDPMDIFRLGPSNLFHVQQRLRAENVSLFGITHNGMPVDEASIRFTHLMFCWIAKEQNRRKLLNWKGEKMSGPIAGLCDAGELCKLERLCNQSRQFRRELTLDRITEALYLCCHLLQHRVLLTPRQWILQFKRGRFDMIQVDHSANPTSSWWDNVLGGPEQFTATSMRPTNQDRPALVNGTSTASHFWVDRFHDVSKRDTRDEGVPADLANTNNVPAATTAVDPSKSQPEKVEDIVEQNAAATDAATYDHQSHDEPIFKETEAITTATSAPLAPTQDASIHSAFPEVHLSQTPPGPTQHSSGVGNQHPRQETSVDCSPLEPTIFLAKVPKGGDHKASNQVSAVKYSAQDCRNSMTQPQEPAQSSKPKQPPCRNPKFGVDVEYVDCECSRCTRRNRTVRIGNHGKPPPGIFEIDTMDLRSRIKEAMAAKFGKVEEVLPLHNQDGHPNPTGPFRIRFKDPESAFKSLSAQKIILKAAWEFWILPMATSRWSGMTLGTAPQSTQPQGPQRSQVPYAAMGQQHYTEPPPVPGVKPQNGIGLPQRTGPTQSLALRYSPARVWVPVLEYDLRSPVQHGGPSMGMEVWEANPHAPPHRYDNSFPSWGHQSQMEAMSFAHREQAWPSVNQYMPEQLSFANEAHSGGSAMHQSYHQPSPEVFAGGVHFQHTDPFQEAESGQTAEDIIGSSNDLTSFRTPQPNVNLPNLDVQHVQAWDRCDRRTLSNKERSRTGLARRSKPRSNSQSPVIAAQDTVLSDASMLRQEEEQLFKTEPRIALPPSVAQGETLSNRPPAGLKSAEELSTAHLAPGKAATAAKKKSNRNKKKLKLGLEPESEAADAAETHGPATVFQASVETSHASSWAAAASKHTRQPSQLSEKEIDERKRASNQIAMPLVGVTEHKRAASEQFSESKQAGKSGFIVSCQTSLPAWPAITAQAAKLSEEVREKSQPSKAPQPSRSSIMARHTKSSQEARVEPRAFKRLKTEKSSKPGDVSTSENSAPTPEVVRKAKEIQLDCTSKKSAETADIAQTVQKSQTEKQTADPKAKPRKHKRSRKGKKPPVTDPLESTETVGELAQPTAKADPDTTNSSGTKPSQKPAVDEVFATTNNVAGSGGDVEVDAGDDLLDKVRSKVQGAHLNAFFPAISSTKSGRHHLMLNALRHHTKLSEDEVHKSRFMELRSDNADADAELRPRSSASSVTLGLSKEDELIVAEASTATQEWRGQSRNRSSVSMLESFEKAADDFPKTEAAEPLESLSETDGEPSADQKAGSEPSQATVSRRSQRNAAKKQRRAAQKEQAKKAADEAKNPDVEKLAMILSPSAPTKDTDSKEEDSASVSTSTTDIASTSDLTRVRLGQWPVPGVGVNEGYTLHQAPGMPPEQNTGVWFIRSKNGQRLDSVEFHPYLDDDGLPKSQNNNIYGLDEYRKPSIFEGLGSQDVGGKASRLQQILKKKQESKGAAGKKAKADEILEGGIDPETGKRRVYAPRRRIGN